ncbi:MAG: hypothetical protein HC915_00120 [Anaerolineae bacterium]|nr:hypothetical protein [Anaerolineae bacterium]
MGRWRWAGLLVALMLCWGPCPITLAQGGLADEDRALLERALEGLRLADRYQSYIITLSETESLSLGVEQATGQATLERTTLLDETRQVQRASGLVDSVARVTVAVEEEAGGTQRDYALEAEVRAVEGTLYVNASYVEPGPALPPAALRLAGDQQSGTVCLISSPGPGSPPERRRRPAA